MGRMSPKAQIQHRTWCGYHRGKNTSPVVRVTFNMQIFCFEVTILLITTVMKFSPPEDFVSLLNAQAYGARTQLNHESVSGEQWCGFTHEHIHTCFYTHVYAHSKYNSPELVCPCTYIPMPTPPLQLHHVRSVQMYYSK